MKDQRKVQSIPEERFRRVVAEHTSIAACLNAFHLTHCGNNYVQFRKRVRLLGISLDHFEHPGARRRDQVRVRGGVTTCAELAQKEAAHAAQLLRDLREYHGRYRLGALLGRASTYADTMIRDEGYVSRAVYTRLLELANAPEHRLAAIARLIESVAPSETDEAIERIYALATASAPVVTGPEVYQ